MKRKIMVLIAAVCLAAVISVTFAACARGEWNDGSYDLSLPDFSAVTADSGVGEDGWYLVFEDEFKGDSESSGLQSALNASTVFGEVYKRKNPDLFENGSVKRGIWTTSPEGVRLCEIPCRSRAQLMRRLSEAMMEAGAASRNRRATGVRTW